MILFFVATRSKSYFISKLSEFFENKFIFSATAAFLYLFIQV